MKGRNCYQDVYVKRKGRWMAIAAHVVSLVCNSQFPNEKRAGVREYEDNFPHFWVFYK